MFNKNLCSAHYIVECSGKKHTPYHLRVYNLLEDQELWDGKTEDEIRELVLCCQIISAKGSWRRERPFVIEGKEGKALNLPKVVIWGREKNDFMLLNYFYSQ